MARCSVCTRNSVYSVTLQHAPDAILYLDPLGKALYGPQRTIQVSLCTDGSVVFIYQLQREISNNPKEAGEEAGKRLACLWLVRLLFRLGFDVLRQLNDE